MGAFLPRFNGQEPLRHQHGGMIILNVKVAGCQGILPLDVGFMQMLPLKEHPLFKVRCAPHMKAL